MLWLTARPILIARDLLHRCNGWSSYVRQGCRRAGQKEVDDEDRYRELAAAYLATATERRKDGTFKSAQVVSPTHAEAARITDAIRDGLRGHGKLKHERVVQAWVPAHMTDSQKADATEYLPGDLLQFHQNAKGFNKCSRLKGGSSGHRLRSFHEARSTTS
jgi:Arc/MetJ-type ribon-helix-helix transcriptional regulator